MLCGTLLVSAPTVCGYYRAELEKELGKSSTCSLRKNKDLNLDFSRPKLDTVTTPSLWK